MSHLPNWGRENWKKKKNWIGNFYSGKNSDAFQIINMTLGEDKELKLAELYMLMKWLDKRVLIEFKCYEYITVRDPR